MSVLKSWTGGALMLLALAGGSRAETTVSQSNDPTEIVEQGLMQLLFQERVGMSSVPPERVAAITTAPRPRWPWQRQVVEQPFEITDSWLATQPKASGDAQFECLAKTIYHEARGEDVAGQVAVAEVVLNRLDDPRFPRSICAVVRQGNRSSCQFSWTCDGRSDAVGDAEAWDRATKIARAMLDGTPRRLTEGATFFHTRTARPTWARRFERTVKIGGHTFYRRPLQTAEIN
jgi:spore germination cell wall hydrolase CwlJ-like protein